MSKVRSATESIIRAEELENQEDEMNTDDNDSSTDQNKPDFPSISALDSMVIFIRLIWKKIFISEFLVIE